MVNQDLLSLQNPDACNQFLFPVEVRQSHNEEALLTEQSQKIFQRYEHDHIFVK